jgi:hypothetical protein
MFAWWTFFYQLGISQSGYLRLSFKNEMAEVNPESKNP